MARLRRIQGTPFSVRIGLFPQIHNPRKTYKGTRGSALRCGVVKLFDAKEFDVLASWLAQGFRGACIVAQG